MKIIIQSFGVLTLSLLLTFNDPGSNGEDHLNSIFHKRNYQADLTEGPRDTCEWIREIIEIEVNNFYDDLKKRYGPFYWSNADQIRGEFDFRLAKVRNSIFDELATNRKSWELISNDEQIQQGIYGLFLLMIRERIPSDSDLCRIICSDFWQKNFGIIAYNEKPICREIKACIFEQVREIENL